MDDTVNLLAQRALALSNEERSHLVDLLLESLQEPSTAEVDEAWSKEVERRLIEHDRGDGITIAAADVFSKARNIAR